MDFSKDENGRNTYIREILRSKDYNIADQTRRGKSETGKQAGNLDFEIMYTNERPYAIYEGLNLKNLKKSGKEYWNRHWIKLLDNYNPLGIPLTFLVCYAKCPKEDFKKYELEYFKYIRNYSALNYSVLLCQKCERKETYVFGARVVYECGGVFVTTYHILVRMDE